MLCAVCTEKVDDMSEAFSCTCRRCMIHYGDCLDGWALATWGGSSGRLPPTSWPTYPGCPICPDPPPLGRDILLSEIIPKLSQHVLSQLLTGVLAECITASTVESESSYFAGEMVVLQQLTSDLTLNGKLAVVETDVDILAPSTRVAVRLTGESGQPGRLLRVKHQCALRGVHSTSQRIAEAITELYVLRCPSCQTPFELQDQRGCDAAWCAAASPLAI